MKKLLAIFLVFFMFFSVVIAQDADTTEEASVSEVNEIESEAITEETKEQVKLMVESNYGATVRVWQLRKSIIRAVIAGEVVIDYLDEKGEDVLDLQAKLDELNIIEKEVIALDSDNSSVEDFVNIKRDAKNLISEFKELTRNRISSEDRNEIIEIVKKEMEENRLLDSTESEMEKARNQLNAERTERLLERFGITDKELANKVRNGEITKNELKEQLRGKYKNIGQEKKKQAKQKIETKNNEVQERIKKRVEEIKQTHIPIRKERLENRLEKMPLNTKLEVQEEVNNKVKKLERVGEKLNINFDKLRGGRR